MLHGKVERVKLVCQLMLMRVCLQLPGLGKGSLKVTEGDRKMRAQERDISRIGVFADIMMKRRP